MQRWRKRTTQLQIVIIQNEMRKPPKGKSNAPHNSTTTRWWACAKWVIPLSLGIQFVSSHYRSLMFLYSINCVKDFSHDPGLADPTVVQKSIFEFLCYWLCHDEEYLSTCRKEAKTNTIQYVGMNCSLWHTANRLLFLFVTSWMTFFSMTVLVALKGPLLAPSMPLKLSFKHFKVEGCFSYTCTPWSIYLFLETTNDLLKKIK